MLVLSRLRDETIMIGDDIEITVVDIRGDKVRLGINAPSRIAVHRKEIYDAIRRENEQAAQSAAKSAALPALTGQQLSPGPLRSRSLRPQSVPGPAAQGLSITRPSTLSLPRTAAARPAPTARAQHG